MAHYAKVVKGAVTQVIVADADFFTTFVDSTPGQWLETCEHCRGGVHYNADGTPSTEPAHRANFASVGDVYNRTYDVFYRQQPYPSWSLQQGTWTWQAPTPMPTDGANYQWQESSQTWQKL